MNKYVLISRGIPVGVYPTVKMAIDSLNLSYNVDMDWRDFDGGFPIEIFGTFQIFAVKESTEAHSIFRS